MSPDHKKSSDDNFTQELDLPEELQELESQLQGFAPVASAVDRDALMYQAGWDAAKVQAQGGAKWFFPSVTAALAAALLFLLLTPPTHTPPASSLQRAGIDSQTHSSPLTPTPSPQTPKNQIPPHKNTFPLHRYRLYPANAPFLTLRDQALRSDFNHLDFKITSMNPHTADYSSPPEVTRHEMLQEFLPSTDKNKPTRPRSFLWPTWNLGETS